MNVNEKSELVTSEPQSPTSLQKEAPQVVYSMPSDVAVFLHLLPNIVGSIATKHSDAKTIRDLAIGLARETTGQLVALGVCQRTTLCLDNYPLATSGAAPQVQSAAAPVLGNNNGHGTQGAMVAHYLSQETRKIPTL